MTDEKPWYGSRTILANAIGGLAALAAVFGLDLSAESQAQVATLVMVLTNLVNIGLRFATSKPIARRKPTGLHSHWLATGGLVALVLLLAACGGRIAPVTVTAADGGTPRQVIYAAHVDYLALLTAANAYTSLPRCEDDAVLSDAACSRPRVVEIIRAADNDAFIVLKGAQAIARDESSEKGVVQRWADRTRSALGVLRAVLANHNLIEGAAS